MRRNGAAKPTINRGLGAVMKALRMTATRIEGSDFHCERCSPPSLPSRIVFKVRAQIVDRIEPHHALLQLRFYRSIGIERVGHPIDNT
jgi:hypothetical protein